ncbi:1,4-dihydroxy-2-naphthoate polyprenyltransferase [bacterium]|nr:1,4-dihydroxy-2-naphthoate polyprenyltransferase [bacterium]
MTPLKAWVLAARPPTLWAAVAPVLVGSGLAANDGVFLWDVFVVTLITAVLINVAANFANDASDAGKGADTAERIGPQRAVASGLIPARTMWIGTAGVVAAAVTGGIYLTWRAGWVVVVIGLVSIIAMLGYTGGPRPYGYRGFGEVSVFVFFGLAATVGSRYVHDRSAPLDAWLLAVPVGMLVTAILVANNVRDLDTDRATGKRTLAVMMGRPATRALFATLVWGAFVVLAVVAGAGWAPRGTLLGLAAAPLSIAIVRTVMAEVEGPPLIGALKGTARLHALTGALIGIGAIL